MAKTAEFDKWSARFAIWAVFLPAFLYLIWKYFRNVIYLRTDAVDFRHAPREQYEFHR
jgi:hypothetical protein